MRGMLVSLLLVAAAGCGGAGASGPSGGSEVLYTWTDPGGTIRMARMPRGPVVLFARGATQVEVDPPDLRWQVPFEPGAHPHAVEVDGAAVDVTVVVPAQVADPSVLGADFLYPDPKGPDVPDAIRSHPAAFRRPSLFFLVEPAILNRRVSRRFVLRDFTPWVRQGAAADWCVLDYGIVEKAEAFADALPGIGRDPGDLKIVSAYRSPGRNRREDASVWSRHIYGDAVDLIVDSNRDGRMDDLTGDGIVGPEDLRLLAGVVSVIESGGRCRPGGCGLYQSSETQGAVHIDARGHRARWAEPEILGRIWDETGW